MIPSRKADIKPEQKCFYVHSNTSVHLELQKEAYRCGLNPWDLGGLVIQQWIEAGFPESCANRVQKPLARRRFRRSRNRPAVASDERQSARRVHFTLAGESMAAADSHATTKNGQGLERFTPLPELNEEGSAFKPFANTGYDLVQVTGGINPNALHRLGFMPRKHLHHTGQSSLGTGSGKLHPPHPEPSAARAG